MTDDLRAAAAKFAELDDDEQRRPEPPKEKLPRARSYLRAARWGFNEMVEQRHLGAAFIFHLAGVVTVARAVPQALTNTDCEQSDAHRKVIGEWFERTKPGTTPVIDFLKEVRDVALHEGRLQSYATRANIRRNEVIIETGYDVGRYDEQGQRHDLIAELRWAFDWLETELQQIEAQLAETSQ
jgi:hypothetical protein